MLHTIMHRNASSAIRNIVFILLLLGLVILPSFGISGDIVLFIMSQIMTGVLDWVYGLL